MPKYQKEELEEELRSAALCVKTSAYRKPELIDENISDLCLVAKIYNKNIEEDLNDNIKERIYEAVLIALEEPEFKKQIEWEDYLYLCAINKKMLNLVEQHKDKFHHEKIIKCTCA